MIWLQAASAEVNKQKQFWSLNAISALFTAQYIFLLQVCICQMSVFAKSDGWGRTQNDTKSCWLKEKKLQSCGNGQDTKLNSVSVILNNKHCGPVVYHNKKAAWSLKMTTLCPSSNKNLPIHPQTCNLFEESVHSYDEHANIYYHFYVAVSSHVVHVVLI